MTPKLTPERPKMPPDGTGDEPWEAPDGTLWLHFPQYGEWHGWQSGEDGLWILSDEEFRQIYGSSGGSRSTT